MKLALYSIPISHMNNFTYPFSLMVILLFSCNQEKPPIETGSYNKFNLIDSTYRESYEKYFFKDSIDTEYFGIIPALSTWNEAIRLRMTSGYGSHNLICTIYKSDTNKIQLLGTIAKRRIVGGQLFYEPLRLEKVITNQEYYSILNYLVESGVTLMGFEVNPETRGSHADRFSIAIKNKDYRKVVTFQFPNINYLNEKSNEYIAMNTFRTILRLAGYPAPNGQLKIENKIGDSLVFSYCLDDFGLTTYRPEVLFSTALKSARIIAEKKDHTPRFRFIIPVSDTVGLISKIKIFGVLPPNDTIFARTIYKL